MGNSKTKTVLEKQSGRDVMDQLVELISKAGIKPGDRLPPEVEIAQTLGMGRAKLREALTAWARMGIVSRNRGGGTILTAPISGRTMTIPLAVSFEGEGLLRTLAVRRPLEIEAVRLASRCATSADRDRIMARMLDLMAAYESGEDWREADHDFHSAVHQATGNPLFEQLVLQLHRAFEQVYESPFGMPHLGAVTIPMHRPLAEAVVVGDGVEAVALMTRILDVLETAARTVIEESK